MGELFSTIWIELPMAREDRNTILVENAAVVANTEHAAGQHVIRISAPEVAARAEPGQFIHIRCADSLPMRRPMSIMRVDPTNGFVDFLFKIHGAGSGLLAKVTTNDTVSVMGPIGKPFRREKYRAHAVLIGGGVGIPPMIYLAEHMRQRTVKPIVFMGSEIPFPFTPKPSQLLVSGIPDEAIASMPLLEDWGIPSRLATTQNFAGCFDGFVTQLADDWLSSQTEIDRNDIEIFACGPTPMLKAVVTVAQRHQIANQISLEEYMACAVGGCAGCTVLTETEGVQKMQRVCVDGPVFNGNDVIFQV
ncbi:MAG: dihydroorotate dehydrogenase electron transfer subunit [Pseudomonadota bacterium]